MQFWNVPLWCCVNAFPAVWVRANRNAHVFTAACLWGICLTGLQLAWKMNKQEADCFWIHFLPDVMAGISLLMVGAKSNFSCVPLDNSMSPTMCWIYVWQIHSHNASLIYSCPQVCPIIINEASEILCTILSVLLTGPGAWKTLWRRRCCVWQIGCLTLSCVTKASRDEEQTIVFAKSS